MARALDMVKKFGQGAKCPRYGGFFSENEMAGRLSKLRAGMAQQNIDACLFTSHQNIAYYSGYFHKAFGRPYGLLVTQDQNTTIAPNVDGGHPHRRSFGDTISYTDFQKDNFYKVLDEMLHGASGGVRRLGVEMGNLTVERFGKVKDLSAISEDGMVECGELAMQLRLVKSDEEVALLSEGARIADVAGHAVMDALRAGGVGIPEFEVVMAGEEAMIKEIARSHPDVELMDSTCWLQSGVNTDGAHNPATTRRIQRGDILSMNCFPLLNGYFSANERTIFMGECSDAHRKIWEANVEVYHRGLELLKPGVRCSDVALELNALCEKHDIMQYKAIGYGHLFGQMHHYYGRESAVEFREDVHTVLQPNMVVSMEPMLILPLDHPAAGGYRDHAMMHITENGAKNLSKFPEPGEKNMIIEC